MERTYFELKITFVHILILLVAIILIGILLFYMGYKAGYRSGPTDADLAAAIEKQDRPAKVEPVIERPTYAAKKEPTPPQKSINDEEKLYPAAAGAQKTPESAPVKSGGQSFFTIRVGAFSSQANAAAYGAKFEKLGYAVKVQAPDPGGTGKLFYVLVGKFSDAAKATSQKEELENLEKKRFLIVPYR